MDRTVTEKEATASCSNAFESRYLHGDVVCWVMAALQCSGGH